MQSIVIFYKPGSHSVRCARQLRITHRSVLKCSHYLAVAVGTGPAVYIAVVPSVDLARDRRSLFRIHSRRRIGTHNGSKDEGEQVCEGQLHVRRKTNVNRDSVLQLRRAFIGIPAVGVIEWSSS